MSLLAILEHALRSREEHIHRWHSEDSDCYRLFHGQADGFPGLSIDRKGPLLVVQTWKAPLEPGEISTLSGACSRFLEVDLTPCWNHVTPPVDLMRWHRPELPEVRIGRELGVRYELHPRWRLGHPLFDLSLRHARRWLGDHSEGRSVLSLFARGCSLGLAATVGRAAEIWHVDRDPLALHWGKKSAQLNPIGRRPIRWLQTECTPILRQLGGLTMAVQGDREIEYLPVEPRRFDRVLLDPPHRSEGPFGTVLLSTDYDHFFQLALRCTRPGGIILATNREPSTDREDWLRAMLHAAQKLRMEIDFEVLHPEADFPETPDRPALKMALFERRI